MGHDVGEIFCLVFLGCIRKMKNIIYERKFSWRDRTELSCVRMRRRNAIKEMSSTSWPHRARPFINEMVQINSENLIRCRAQLGTGICSGEIGFKVYRCFRFTSQEHWPVTWFWCINFLLLKLLHFAEVQTSIWSAPWSRQPCVPYSFCDCVVIFWWSDVFRVFIAVFCQYQNWSKHELGCQHYTFSWKLLNFAEVFQINIWNFSNVAIF